MPSSLLWSTNICFLSPLVGAVVSPVSTVQGRQIPFLSGRAQQSGQDKQALGVTVPPFTIPLTCAPPKSIIYLSLLGIPTNTVNMLNEFT